MGDSQVEEIKRKSDIVEVVGERVALKRAGRNLKGLCPFHGEKTPSFFVTPEIQIFKCFGCGESGDVISFVQKYEGMTFVEALEHLAKKAGVTLKRREMSGEDALKERLLSLLDTAGEYYHYILSEHKAGAAAREYSKKRGVGKKMQKQFKLGYAPASYSGLLTYLTKKKKYTPQELEQAGMVIKSDGGRHYDRFRGRVMFPLTNFAGRVVGFSGRLLDSEAKEAKYINTPETLLYHKAEMLFGIAENKKAIRMADRVVVTEGEMDVISSVKMGLGEVVAIKGSAFSEAQALLIRRLTNRVILALDADEAGQEAIRRAIPIAEKQGLYLKVVHLAEGKDADELIQADPKAWREAVDNAVSVYQFYIDSAVARFDVSDGEGQKRITQMVLPVLKQIENSVERLFYIKKLAERLGVPVHVVEEQLSRTVVGKEGGRVVAKVEEERKMSRRERAERGVMAVMLHFERQLPVAYGQLEKEWVGEDYLQQLLAEMEQLLSKGVTSSQDLMERLPEHLRQLAETLYSSEVRLFEYNSEELANLYKRGLESLQLLWLKEKLSSVSRQLVKVSDEEKVKQLQDEYHRLSRKLSQLD